LRGYSAYAIPNIHFKQYQGYFERIGRPIAVDERGAGLIWISRFFQRFVPFHSVMYVGCTVALVPLVMLGENWLNDTAQAIAIVTLSLSPILVAEMTRAPQFARPYFPALIGILFLIGYTAFRVDQLLPVEARIAFWSLSAVTLTANAVWNAWVFVDDVWPARMAAAWLRRDLEALKIKEFYTYDTPYNDAFVNALPPGDRNQYRITHINSLSDADRGYVVVPGTSAKAWNMESQFSGIKNGDFDLDPELNRLLASGDITKYAVASFKTFGTSRIWVQESEAPTYRDLILREVSDYDRWRGRAWILDAERLYEASRT
jgi:hypothetical protein